MSVKDVVESAISILWQGNFELDTSGNHPHEANLLLLDNTKAKTLLGWKPKYNVTETLQRTFNWYKMYYENKWRIEQLALEEINQF
jgi:CDP-glucose 4,6-dehydratase